MKKRVLVIGAVALGPKAACRFKRLQPSAQVTMIDKDSLISYGGCGIPYYVGGDIPEIKGLYSTSAHVVRDCDYFRNVKGIEVFTEAEAQSIDRRNRSVRVHFISEQKTRDLPYDDLVLAIGANPVLPPIQGTDLSGVHVVATLHHAESIKHAVSKGEVERAVIIGGGAIGLEMAEAFADLWGIETVVIEMMDQLLPSAFGKDMALIVKNHMEEKGVDIRLGERVARIVGNGENRVEAVETDHNRFPCDVVIMAVGARPNSRLAQEAGLAVGRSGGILVDRRMRTSDPHIYAGGDCVEIPHLVSGASVHMPLGSLANRQGRVIGTNLAGGSAFFRGTVGTFCLKVFDYGVARAGLTVAQAADAGFDPVHTVVVQSDRAHFYPTMELMYIKLIADRRSRKILGIEAAGTHGDAVKARVDAVASLLPQRPDIDDISNLELTYAPPFASAMDILNNASNSLDNIIAGSHHPIDVMDFLKAFKKDQVRVLDVRNPVQAGPFVKKYGDRWLNINQDVLGCSLDQVPRDEPLMLVCGSGPRSYEAQILLKNQGINPNTKNVQGGIGMILVTDPEFAPAGYKKQ